MPDTDSAPFAAFRDDMFTGLDDLERNARYDPQNFVLDADGGAVDVSVAALMIGLLGGEGFTLPQESLAALAANVGHGVDPLSVFADLERRTFDRFGDQRVGGTSFDASFLIGSGPSLLTDVGDLLGDEQVPASDSPFATLKKGGGEISRAGDDIEVVGRRSSFDIGIYLDSFGGLGQELELSEFARAGRVLRWGGGLPGAIIGGLLSLAADWLLGESDVEKAEQKMRDEITKPGNTIVRQGTTPDGKPFVVARDGWTYVDSDRNGQYDVRGKQNADGSYTLDNGSSIMVVR